MLPPPWKVLWRPRTTTQLERHTFSSSVILEKWRKSGRDEIWAKTRCLHLESLSVSQCLTWGKAEHCRDRTSWLSFRDQLKAMEWKALLFLRDQVAAMALELVLQNQATWGSDRQPCTLSTKNWGQEVKKQLVLQRPIYHPNQDN